MYMTTPEEVVPVVDEGHERPSFGNEELCCSFEGGSGVERSGSRQRGKEVKT